MKKAMILTFLTLTTLLTGCGSGDGLEELAAGREAAELKDYIKASKLLSKSLEITPDRVDALVSLAQVKLALGDLTAAKQSIKRAYEINHDDLDVRYLSGQIAWHLKEYDEAGRLYKELADDMNLDAKDRARGWTGLGIVQMAKGEAHLSRISFLTAIRLDRRNAAAWYHLGLLYRDSPFGYNEAALDEFNIYVRLDTEASPRVQKTQRVIIPALKESISRAAMDRPGVSKRDSAACAKLLSEAEAAVKKAANKTALKKYEEALKADPLSYPAALGVAKLMVKVDNSKIGQQKALEAYLVACQLRPSAVATFLTAGELAAKLSLNVQAVDIYSRAVAANPASLDALDGLIRALRKIKGKNALASAYQRYRDILPKPKAKK